MIPKTKNLEGFVEVLKIVGCFLRRVLSTTFAMAAAPEENDPEYLKRTLEQRHTLNISEDPINFVQPSPSLQAVPQAKEGYRIRLLAGTANPELNLRIAEGLGVKLESADNKK